MPQIPTETRDAPTSILGIAKQLGPGLIIAGSIVGSGELIATTLTGAESGFWLMWLIIVGCVIKVFTQLAIGRYTVTSGRTALQGLAQLPGFKPAGVHWVVWFWLLMFFATIGQMGGIVGAIGQAVGMAQPITQDGQAFNEAADAMVKAKFDYLQTLGDGSDPVATAVPAAALEEPIDVKIWALLITAVTAVLLYRGGYALIEKFVLVLVGGFTLISIYNFAMLQMNADWAIRLSDLRQGLGFGLPPVKEGVNPMVTALATFGIIGMAAGEIIYYPYWCLEKGYAKFVGPREDTPEWNERARGWLRIMKIDAWAAMIVYTLSTLVFYCLGAAVLNRADISPSNADLVRTLAAMFEPVFGSTATVLFMVGAIAVLYSTFFVGSASQARVFADAIENFKRVRKWKFDTSNLKRNLSFGLPILSFVIYIGFSSPIALVLISGFMNTLMLPLLAFSALYFRKRFEVPALKPSLFSDVMLWVSAVGLLAFGAWALWGQIQNILSQVAS